MTTPLTVHPIPAFDDNYIWCIHDGCHAVVVDPGDATPVLAFLTKHNLRLEAVLITHHHYDHVGGLAELSDQFTHLTVYGPHNPRIQGITNRVGERDKVVFERFGLSFEIFEVPGHTLDHIAYYANDWLFCGDTLFSAGCGRLFEGTPKQMLTSLKKLTALPPHTQVFCTHEYTLSNLAFALAVEPANNDIQIAIDKVTQMREVGLPSLPTNLSIEKDINPFLRANIFTHWPHIAKHTGKIIEDEESAFAAVRGWKDAFRG